MPRYSTRPDLEIKRGHGELSLCDLTAEGGPVSVELVVEDARDGERARIYLEPEDVPRLRDWLSEAMGETGARPAEVKECSGDYGYCDVHGYH